MSRKSFRDEFVKPYPAYTLWGRIRRFPPRHPKQRQKQQQQQQESSVAGEGAVDAQDGSTGEAGEGGVISAESTMGAGVNSRARPTTSAHLMEDAHSMEGPSEAAQEHQQEVTC